MALYKSFIIIIIIIDTLDSAVEMIYYLPLYKSTTDVASDIVQEVDKFMPSSTCG